MTRLCYLSPPKRRRQKNRNIFGDKIGAPYELDRGGVVVTELHCVFAPERNDRRPDVSGVALDFCDSGFQIDSFLITEQSVTARAFVDVLYIDFGLREQFNSVACTDVFEVTSATAFDVGSLDDQSSQASSPSSRI